MNMAYENLICHANKLIRTFTISYNVGIYCNELFSSTYDELNGWVKEALKEIEAHESGGRECELYKFVRKFRGRTGDITLNQFQRLIHQLEETH